MGWLHYLHGLLVKLPMQLVHQLRFTFDDLIHFY